jgi:hypothetical protein
MENKITPESWASWKNNPTTKAFIKFLSDYRISIAKGFAERIGNGEVIPEEELRYAAILCGTYRDVEEARYEDVEQFYKSFVKEEKENGEQINDA